MDPAIGSTTRTLSSGSSKSRFPDGNLPHFKYSKMRYESPSRRYFPFGRFAGTGEGTATLSLGTWTWRVSLGGTGGGRLSLGGWTCKLSLGGRVGGRLLWGGVRGELSRGV